MDKSRASRVQSSGHIGVFLTNVMHRRKNMSTNIKMPPESSHHSTAPTNNGFEPLLDSLQAAELLRIHPKTLQRMARNGKIVAIQIGKLWRYRASELNLWLTSKKRAS
jgi:excisionase family DNA binding protein